MYEKLTLSQILKRAWGDDPPASALFADNMWYKAEAYVGSEYAGKYLYDNKLVPIYVSDNPVLNAQHVIFESSKAYKYGLPYHAALAAVTTAPAERLGLGQRLGKVKAGFDADIVVWDSDPLSVGATPVQIWIDGTAQYENPIELSKRFGGPILPNEDLANIVEDPTTLSGDVVFTGITRFLLPTDAGQVTDDGRTLNVAVSKGKITCVGLCSSELRAASDKPDRAVIHLKNGYVTPSFTAFGSTLGLNAVDDDRDTDNGDDGHIFSRGIDGLALGTKKLHVSHRYGVTRAISAPKFAGGATHHGTSVGFLTGAATALAPGAILTRDAALHYTLDLSAKRASDGTPSLSAAVGALRDKLLGAVTSGSLSSKEVSGKNKYSETMFLQKVVTGKMPLAITVHSADTIAAVLRVKADVEEAITESTGHSTKLQLVVIGGSEAHLLAGELAAASVGVVLSPMLSYATSWDQRRALTGAPLTNGTTIDALIDAGVITAVGLEEDWVVRDLGLLAGIAYKNSQGRLGEKDVVDLVSGNVYKILGLEELERGEHFVIHEGSPLEIDSRIKAISDGITGVVDVF